MATPVLWDSGQRRVRPITSADSALASGAITSGMLGDGAVVSGTIASGQIAGDHLSSGAVQSGHIGDDAIVGGNISSGAVQSGAIGDGAVVSGSIASGQVGSLHLADGAVLSGDIGNGAIVSGNIASGQIGADHIASGTIQEYNLDPNISINRAEILVEPTFTAAENISGGICVTLNASGFVVLAGNGVAARMPAIGVAEAAVASGAAVSFVHQGRMYNDEFAFGTPGEALWVGASGELTGSVPAASGQIAQRMGKTKNASGLFVLIEEENYLDN